jgi:class 3 adenylate cyclase/TolB-like protein
MSQAGIDSQLRERRLSAILAADVVGYSRLMGDDEEGTLAAVKAHRKAVVDPAIANHRGRIVKTTGDGMLVEFASAVDAVRCAVDIQRSMAERNEAVPPDKRIQFRIGINVGDIIGDGADIYGDGVNVAARLEGMAEPGGIWVSQAVRDPVRDKLSFSFEDLGNVSAKNIARPIHVFRVRHDTETRRAKFALVPATRRLIVVAVAVLAVLGAGAGALFWREHSQANGPPPLSVVVLPFDNVGGEAADSYLATGVTDDLTAALSHIPGAFVISRATAYTYRGKTEDIRRIGRDLNVRYVVRGSMQRFAQRLKVTAELSSTETGARLWSDSFEQNVSDLAAGQEQIVIRMRAALNIRLADIEAARSLRERPTNPDAFDLILQARAVNLLPQTKETITKALGLYERALASDPNSVLALARAADTVLSAHFYGMMPYEVAMPRALQYLERARALEPNAESVLAAQSTVLDFQEGEIDYHRVYGELKTVGQKLIDLYPNNPIGYFRLGVLGRNQGRYDEAAGYFSQVLRLNPRQETIKNLYWNMAYCAVRAGHDREGLDWIDRAMRAEGSLPAWRTVYLDILRAVAYVRAGDLETAKRIAKELNDHYPFPTWRSISPNDPNSETDRQQSMSFADALRTAGLRDHVDPDADFGVASEDALHLEFDSKTPMTAAGVTTVRTDQLEGMLQDRKPLVIDTMSNTWYRSIPGAVGLEFHGNTHGSFDDAVQKRLGVKLLKLTSGDMTKPIVAVGWNAASYDGYNLALRICHAGYTNVYWYRGGREAWEVAGKPEEVTTPVDW